MSILKKQSKNKTLWVFLVYEATAKFVKESERETATNMFYKLLVGIPFDKKINIQRMEMMTSCYSEVNLNLESLSNCNFLKKY